MTIPSSRRITLPERGSLIDDLPTLDTHLTEFTEEEQVEALADKSLKITSGSPTPRLTCLSQTYFQSPHSEAKMYDKRYTRTLLSEEEPVERRFTVEESWKKLDMGWFSTMSYFSLTHLHERFTVQPTEEEMAIITARRVEIGVALKEGDEPITFATLAPGESQPILGVDTKRYYLRVIGSNAKCHLVLVPA